MYGRFLRTTSCGLAGLLSAVMMAGSAGAAPMVDQANTGTLSGTLGIMSSDPIWQEFVPDLPFLFSVDVFLADADVEPEFVDITLEIKEGSSSGALLGSVTVTGYSAFNDGEQLNFAFAVQVGDVVTGTPLVLELGETYVIQLTASNALARWSYTGGNLYEEGQAYLVDTPFTNQDYRFQTYAVVPEPGTAALFALGLIGLAFQRRVS